MGQSGFIAAIDLGTSKMIAMAGKKNEFGMLSVVASESSDSGNCIRRGCVYNVEETTKKVTSLITRLNFKLSPSKIEKIYVGIGGQSIRMETFSAIKPVYGKVTDEILLSIDEECRSYQPEYDDVLYILPPEYLIDGKFVADPKSIPYAFKVEARCKLIIGKISLKRTLKNSIEKDNIAIAGFFVAPLATAEAILSEKEKEFGCALIEFGAGVTYVSVYKKSLLRYLVTIPLGGQVITRDITTLNILEDEAENLKVNWGSAVVDLEETDKIEAHPEIKLITLNSVIEARLDEILENVLNQIKQSGYFEELGAGIIITGGGSNLNRIAEVIRKKTDLDVRHGSVKKSLVNQSPDWASDQANMEIIGLLALGTENCIKEMISKPRPVVQDFLFPEEEIPKIEKEKPVRKPVETSHHDQQPPVKKPGGGLFGGLGRKFERLSGKLFEDEDYEEKDKKDNTQD